MKKFIITKHFIERFKEQAGTTGSIKKQMFITYLYSQQILSEGSQLYIKFGNQGICYITETAPNEYTLTTFVGVDRMGTNGKARRAFKS